MTQLYLASASPRRAELLRQIGVVFEQFSVDLDETPLKGESPENYVYRLAIEKAKAGLIKVNTGQSNQGSVVIGSDTAVVLEGKILGKPTDQSDAFETLRLLSGRSHQVMTSVAVVSDQSIGCQVVVTEVAFRALSDVEIIQYWQTGEPADKAGSYGIQGAGAVFVKHISGSYSAVVGLPLQETAELLSENGIQIWQDL